MSKALNVIFSLGINKRIRMDYIFFNHLIILNGANESKRFEKYYNKILQECSKH